MEVVNDFLLVLSYRKEKTRVFAPGDTSLLISVYFLECSDSFENYRKIHIHIGVYM
jgi:hypothetical protein